MFVLLSSFQRVKNGRVFPAFYHATFQHALIMCCNVSRAGYNCSNVSRLEYIWFYVKAMWPRINQWQSLFSWVKVWECNSLIYLPLLAVQWLLLLSASPYFQQTDPKETTSWWSQNKTQRCKKTLGTETKTVRNIHCTCRLGRGKLNWRAKRDGQGGRGIDISIYLTINFYGPCFAVHKSACVLKITTLWK